MKSMENPSSAEAVHLAHQAGAQVLATCRSEGDKHIALRAGADEVLLADDSLVDRIRTRALNGVDHVVEVAFAANIGTDIQVPAQGASIATYATNAADSPIPVWQLVFKNVRLFFVGNDDVPVEAKVQATPDITRALESGRNGLDIAARLSLEDIATAHEWVEHPEESGRLVILIHLLDSPHLSSTLRRCLRYGLP